MRHPQFIAAGAAALLALTGCGGTEQISDPAAEEAPNTDQEETGHSGQVDAEPLAWGEPATVLGDEGSEIELVPVAIRYYDQDDLSAIVDETMLPQGTYVIVQFDATAQETQDSLGWADGTGFTWRVDGQQIGRSDSGDPPWTGHTDGFYGEPILPDEGARSGLVYFDIPGAGEGNLAYADDMTGTVIRWEVPAESESDQGPLWDDVDSAVSEWS